MPCRTVPEILSRSSPLQRDSGFFFQIDKIAHFHVDMLKEIPPGRFLVLGKIQFARAVVMVQYLIVESQIRLHAGLRSFLRFVPGKIAGLLRSRKEIRAAPSFSPAEYSIAPPACLRPGRSCNGRNSGCR